MAAIDRLTSLASETTLGIKAPCLVATIGANITLAGVQDIDGVTVGNNSERVLVKDQTDATQNGIYIASTGNWTRALDAAGNTDWAQGTLVITQTGATNAGVLFSQMAAGPVIIGETDVAFGQPFSGFSAFKGTVSIALSPSLGTSPLPVGVQAINTLQNISGGVCSVAFNLNQFVLSENINFTAATSELIGWSFIHAINAGATGNRISLAATMNVQGAMTTSADGNQIAPLQASLIVSASQSNSLQGFGFNNQSVVRPNLTGIAAIIGQELDVSVANGSSVDHIAGLSIAMINQTGFAGYTGTQAAAIVDAALLFTAQLDTAGWQNLILIGDWNGAGASPCATSGTSILTTVANPGFKYGIDFSGANPAGSDLSGGFPFRSGVLGVVNFSVDWSGTLIAASLIAATGTFNHVNSPAVVVRSTASGDWTSYSIGRAFQEGFWGVAATPAQFFSTSAAGDIAFAAETGNLLLGTQAGGEQVQFFSGAGVLALTLAANQAATFASTVAMGQATITLTSLGSFFPAAGANDGLIIQNTTAASLGTQVQGGPNIHLIAQAWNTSTASSNMVDWIISNTPIAGNPVTGYLSLAYQIAGGGYSALSRWFGSATQQLFYIGDGTKNLAGYTVQGGGAATGSANGSGAAFTLQNTNTGPSAYTVLAFGNKSAVLGGSYSDTPLLYATNLAGNALFGIYVNTTSAPSINIGAGIQVGAPTGGDKGTGTINAAAAYFENGTQVVSSRVTGWNAPTTGGGAISRGTYDTGANLLTTAETLAALITDLRTHGLIGT